MIELGGVHLEEVVLRSPAHEEECLRPERRIRGFFGGIEKEFVRCFVCFLNKSEVMRAEKNQGASPNRKKNITVIHLNDQGR